MPALPPCTIEQGINVRQRAGELVSLLSSPGKLQQERERVGALFGWTCCCGCAVLPSAVMLLYRLDAAVCNHQGSLQEMKWQNWGMF